MAAPNYLTDVSSGATPNYLLGADNHNLGNDSTSWFDPTTWGDKLGNAGKFFAVSALSGADSIYNSAVTVSNWFGNDASISDTNAWITTLDSDLGQYYSKNRQAADLAGFIGTSFIPGLGGMKVLNAGQNALKAGKMGFVGRNLGEFTGILAPSTETYVKLAGAELKSAQVQISTLNASTMKALGAGVWQNTLEAAAFETFVQATMFKSPILESQDNWDIAKNILVGGALGGVIGGAFEGARSLRGIKNARLEEDYALKPFNSREVVQDATSPADRIILALENRDMTAVPYIPPLPVGASAADVALREAQLANAMAAVKKKSAAVDNTVRTELHKMSNGANAELINLVADTLQGTGHIEALRNLAGAEEITRVLNTTKLERDAIKNLTPGVQSRYVKLQGENAGEVSFELPDVLAIADRVPMKTGQKLEDAINAEVKSKGFTHKILWDPLAKSSKLSWREAELRYIWADNLNKLPDNSLIHGNDIPLLERFLKDQNIDLRIQVGKTEFKPASVDELKQFIIERKEALSNDIMLKNIDKLDPASNSIETTTAAIAKTLNIKVNWLEGTRDAVSRESDLFAWQTLTDVNHEARIAKGLVNKDSTPVPSYYQPSLAKINYKIPDPLDPNVSSFVADAMVHIKQQQKLFQEQADRVVIKQSGQDIYNRMGELTDIDLANTNSYGGSGGFLSAAQGKFGSPESKVQYMGGVSKDLQGIKRKGVDDTLEGPLYHVSQNKEAAIEVSTVNQQLSRTEEQYVFDTENLLGMGTNVLIPAKYRKAALEGGENFTTDDLAAIRLQNRAPEYIKFNTWEAEELFRAHNQLTTIRGSNSVERAAAFGKVDQRGDADIVRPYRHAVKDYPHFALVKDPRVTGAGHTTMLFANSPRELEELIAKTNRDFPEFQVLTKQDTADYFKAHQEYEYPRGLNQNYIDSSLKSRGIFSNFYTETEPSKVVDTILQYHYRSADVEAAEIMRLKFNSQFNWLEDQAKAYSALESSKFGGGTIEAIQQNEKNPYISYIKTALNLSSTPTSNPWWSLNKWMDNSVSTLVGRVRNSFDKAASPAELQETNELLAKYGSQTAYNSAAEIALVNHTAPKAELSKFVRSANSILSRFTLGLDPLNALNNAIGANVLRGTELAQITRAINQGNEEVAGALARIGKVAIPGVDDTILSPTKLFGNSLQRFANPETRKVLFEEYKAAGFIRDRLEQFWSMADDLTLRGTETASELNQRIQGAFSKAKKLADAGERYTGNKFAEEFNRFISADVARQLTDLAEAGGIMTRAESLTYINTFVNRVEGNTIASQRPGIFQGPLGQAIGLFQSYQFNLLQQMFRYVAEGDKKDLGMLLGLQGTFYGLQGEPGFKFLNDHIVGTLSGNQQHRDMYDMTRGIVGKTAGDWLLYGTSSNILQTNIYSRGDINPRQLSIIPTSLSEVPFVGGMSKVFGTLKETAQKIGQGAPVWETIRQGIEHNGVSRPLAGLAQVASGLRDGNVFSTSSKGTILGSNDLLSLASLSRLAGGRPLDEAIQNDTMFSIHQYEAVDRAKKNLLAESVKTSVIAGQTPDTDSVNQFAAKYAELGGKQGSFAKYMMEQYTKANTSQAEILFQKLNHPMSYKIQALMGGEEH